MKKAGFACLVMLMLSVPEIWAQPGAIELDMLLNTPVAKTLPQKGILTELRMYDGGGLLASIGVGITDQFSIGVSYGGSNIIGSGNVDMNPQPCVQLRALIKEEQFLSPAIVLGFDSQGYNGYNDALDRYEFKSKGLFIVASKNTAILGGLGLHAGANWSLETKDKDKDVNLFFGAHKWLRSDLILLAEYDMAFNDNADATIGEGKGYFNTGVRWSVAQQLYIEFGWKNLFENRSNVPGSSRTVKLAYLSHF